MPPLPLAIAALTAGFSEPIQIGTPSILSSSALITDHLIPFHRESAAYISQPLTPESWIVWVLKNKHCMLFAVLASMHQKQLSSQGLDSISFEIAQEKQVLFSL